MNQHDAEKYFYRGLDLQDNGLHDEAIKEYTKSIELNPNNALAYYHRGIAYDELGEYEEVIADYTKAIEIDPDFADAYFNRGHFYYLLTRQLNTRQNIENILQLMYE